MDTDSTMALEYLSMAATDYLGYDTWIEQEQPVHSDSAMNIGAIMSHLAEYHRISILNIGIDSQKKPLISYAYSEIYLHTEEISHHLLKK